MTSNSEAEVLGVIETWIDAVRRNDLDGVVANHGEAVVFYDVPEPPQTRGLEAYRSAWAEFLGYLTLNGTFEFEDLTVHADEHVACVYGLIRCRGGGEESPFAVRLTMGLRKMEGIWQIVHEHHSVPAS